MKKFKEIEEQNKISLAEQKAISNRLRETA